MWWPDALTRRSFTGGSYVRGYWEDSTQTDTTIECTVQPSTGQQRANVPEGYDSTRSKLIITQVALNPATSGSQRADQIEYPSGSDEWYVVVTLEAWQAAVLPHYEYVMALPDNPAQRT